LCMQTDKDDIKLINRLKENHPAQKTKNKPGYGYFFDEKVITWEPKRRLHFHHARTDRLAGCGNDGLLFTYEALEPGQVFAGEICGSPEILKQFNAFFGPELHARLGRSRKTEYGEVRIELSPVREFGYNEGIFERDGVELNEVIISLLAPCILENDYGYADPSANCFRKYLAEALDINDDEFRITGCFAKTVKVETYLAVWGMKYPATAALDTGSTFRLEFQDLSESICHRLAELAWRGLGERRQEGFGRLGFNLAPREQYLVQNDFSAFSEVGIPADPMPETFRMIIATILHNELRRKVTVLATQYAGQFIARPTNSFLGKLGLMVISVPLGEFGQLLEQLKKPAKSQLEQCHNQYFTLWRFIREFDVDLVKRIMAEELRMSECAERINFVPDTKTEEELYQLFWRVFFHEMRSDNKAGGGEEQDHA
jgi:CRISPR-associated protein Csx10